MRCIFKESISGSVGGRPLNHNDPRYFPYTHRREPLCFGAVCQQWRSIAWGYADVWTTLRFPLSGPGYAHGPQLVSEWLERTGNSLLSIQLHDSEAERNDEDPLRRLLISTNAQEIARIIATCSARCESMRLHTSFLSVIDRILRGAGSTSDSSTLRQLSLDGRLGEDGRTTEDIILLDPEQRPSPTHLCMSSFIPPAKININWSKITHLYAERLSHQAFYFLLSHISSSLTDLCVGSLVTSLIDSPDWFWTGPITLGALTSLSITGRDFGCSLMEFTDMVTPSLHSFSYNGVGLSNRLPVGEFLLLVERSGCEIRNLKFDYPLVSDAELAHLLRSLPTVRNLKLVFNDRFDVTPLFRGLSQKNLRTDTDPFLPNLERLDLSTCAPFWRSFIRIFDDNPASEPSEQNFACVPRRKDLRITLRVKSPVVPYKITDYIDLITLYQLAVLWRKHSVFSVFLSHGEKRDQVKSFLEQSYDAHLAAPGGEENARKLGNGDLRPDILEMASLRF
ncbi:hypothetical protein D9619_012353 [Psilocybe cf. subviscida]|uniref:F-box domain-containing protein n=1 Tax=Psilocybe cf. subviscida TaxID=2480587 RepID=A0A8H5AR65_9AGAR|nr:hypothetical protein D9619_012353 [Psilocybe cf. subviscida]